MWGSGERQRYIERRVRETERQGEAETEREETEIYREAERDREEEREREKKIRGKRCGERERETGIQKRGTGWNPYHGGKDFQKPHLDVPGHLPALMRALSVIKESGRMFSLLQKYFHFLRSSHPGSSHREAHAGLPRYCEPQWFHSLLFQRHRTV